MNKITNATVDIIHPFLQFLTNFSVIPLAFSVIISLNLNELSYSLTETIIAPLVNRLFNDSSIKLKDRVLVIFEIKFEIGLFIINIIQFIFILISLYFLYVFYQYVSKQDLLVSNGDYLSIIQGDDPRSRSNKKNKNSVFD